MKDILKALEGISYKKDGNTVKTVKKDNKQVIINKINKTKYCYNVFVFEYDKLYCDYEALTTAEAVKTIKSYI